MTRYNIESTLKLIVAICFFALFLMADTATDKLDAVMGMTVFSFLWGAFKIVKYNISFSALLEGGFFIIIE